MRKTKLFAILGIAFSLSFAGAGLAACQFMQSGYQIAIDESLPVELAVDDVVDFTKYFTVTDENGNPVEVTEDMLDLTQADTSLPGVFTVTITYKGITQSIEFRVGLKDDADDQGGQGGGTTKPDDQDDELSAAIKKYADRSTWSFAVAYEETYDGDTFHETYEYYGYNVKNVFTGYDENDNGVTYTDYLGYNASTKVHTYYSETDGGAYETYAEGTDDYEYYFAYLRLVDLTALSKVSFTGSNGKYTLQNAGTDAEKLLGEYLYEDYYEEGAFQSVDWTGLDLYIADGDITKIVATLDDETTSAYTFSKQGTVSFALPDGSGSGSGSEGGQGGGQSGNDDPVDPKMMEKQKYDPDTFDNERLHDKIPQAEDSIGLPSTGTYHALVIPVQFTGDSFTEQELSDLRKAFNGTESETGWESVTTYYKKSSYNKLNLTFDIKEPVTASHNSSYYASYSSNNTTGSDLLLKEALEAYDGTIDYNDYDHNNDGCIDAVYLIYSAPVDYTNADFYWAYVTWYPGEEAYDDIYGYYYLFAGVDFIYESTSKDRSSGYERIDGLTLNASTFIHESGHLLGLDDYYDYYENTGSDEGLGGADMMDYTVGDQNVYSKTMLGWVTPTVVNETKTIELTPSESSGECILIPLDFDNSYFSEYLLIDLYTATGLNKLHAEADNSYLYGGAKFGVRIYHVSSSIDNPYSDEYYSFTDNNNSVSKNALIKLVEADGDRKFSSSRSGLAEADDLWKTGQKLSTVFPSYTRNDGKTVNFDIEIVSVSATQATITVTFKN